MRGFLFYLKNLIYTSGYGVTCGSRIYFFIFSLGRHGIYGCMKNIFFHIILPFLFLPQFAFAQIIINEVMYDIEGTDTGREWIEIYNSSSENSYDIVSLKLFENEINHKISRFQGNDVLGANEYGIIADNPDKFLEDNPTYDGHLYDSAFSLNNSGEIFSLKNSDLEEISGFGYTTDDGAAGNGNSLQYNSASILIEAEPTPGAKNAEIVNKISTEDDEGESTDSFETSTHSDQEKISKKKYKIDAGRQRSTFVFSVLELKVESKKVEDFNRKEVNWSFGDGARTFGKKVAHKYNFPGEYIVVLKIEKDGEIYIDRTNIEVLDPDLELSIGEFRGIKFLGIKNLLNQEINLGGFSLRGDNGFYLYIERDTIVSANSSLKLPIKEKQSRVDLYFPNQIIVQSLKLDVFN